MKQRLVGNFSYAGQSWPRERRVFTQLERGTQGCNPRFVASNPSRVGGLIGQLRSIHLSGSAMTAKALIEP